ncbi:MAG: response regulator [Candidatus Vogelbacteria bacterium]|nr:response regulator [Candidatus Vogelbacteria bacterium]
MTFENKKILVVEEVEDEAGLRTALHEKLSDEGFSVLEARDGEEGLEVALRNHPDLILLDIIMPHTNGLKMLKKLREDTWGRTAKVIILTNLGNSGSIANVMDSETFDYIIKSDANMTYIVQKIKDKLRGTK